jgi:hypothetical protein
LGDVQEANVCREKYQNSSGKNTTLTLTSTLFTYHVHFFLSKKCNKIREHRIEMRKPEKPKKYFIAYASENCRLQGNANLDFTKYE